MKIYDVLMFFNELDLLEIRLEVLDKHVDYFVITESTRTFSGNPKALYFSENKERFKKFEHKIIYNICDKNLPEIDQWDRERMQRNSSMPVLENCNDDDIIFCSDADEIPNFNNINLKEIYNPNSLYVCHQDFYYFYFNTLFQDTAKPSNFWEGTRFSSWKLLKDNTIDNLRDINSEFNKNKNNNIIHIPNAGWHFSFLGGAEKAKYKIESYSHQEMNVPAVKDNIQKSIDELRDPFFRSNVRIIPVEMSEKTHPEYLMNNLEKYEEYIRKT